jgi:hypothetical protein
MEFQLHIPFPYVLWMTQLGQQKIYRKMYLPTESIYELYIYIYIYMTLSIFVGNLVFIVGPKSNG